MAKQILSNLDFLGTTKIVNLPDPTSAQDPATKNYVDSAIEGLAWKDNVKVSTQGNLSVASPGATIDGITMVVNDRVLVRAQTTASENGIYLWNGAAVPLTRSLDMNASTEFNQAVVTVDQGTSAGSSFRQTAVAPTIGTTLIAWTSFGTTAGAASTGSAGIVRLATQAETDAGTDATIAVTPATLAGTTLRLKKFAAAFGDGSATAYVITHNLNTLDVHVAVYRTTGAGDEVSCDVGHTTVNTVTLTFAVAPTANQFRAVVIG